MWETYGKIDGTCGKMMEDVGFTPVIVQSLLLNIMIFNN